MPTQTPGQPPRRPARAPNSGNGNGGRVPGRNQSGKPAKPPKAPTAVGQATKFIFTPEIGRSFESVKFAWHILVNLVAQVYAGVGLIEKNHPCLNLRNASRYKLQDIIKIAFQSLKWEREYIPQIIIFLAVLAFLFFIALSGATLLMNLGVNAAHAATGDPGDSASDVLNQIFNINGSGMIPTAFGAMLKAYSNLVLILAGLILIWTIITYVVESARHGQAGGKGFNHSWAPVRLVFALGLLIPLSSGLNSGQYIVLYLAKWGSDMATKVYTQFNQQVQNGQGVTVNNSEADAQKNLSKVFKIYLDAYRANNQIPACATDPTQCPIAIPTPPADLASLPDVPGKTNYKKLEFLPNNTASSLGNQKGVGEIDFYYNPNANMGCSSPGSPEDLSNCQSALLIQQIPNIQTVAGDTAKHFDSNNDTSYGRAIDQKLLKSTFDAMTTQYKTAITNSYQSAVQSANTTLASAMNAALNNVGWISAPIWTQKIAQMNADMQEAKNALPDVIPVKGDNLGDQLLGEAQEDISPPSFVQRLGNVFQGTFLQNIGPHLYKSWIMDAPNPYASMITLGHAILATAQAALVGWTALAIGLGVSSTTVAGFGTQAGVAAVQAFTPLVTSFISLLFTNGYMLGLFFPLIPIFRFIFAVLGWITIVLIGVMGMPLFALAHLKTGGEGWVGQLQVASTYNMLIGIVLRPTLTIIGYILGVILFNQAIKLCGYILISALDVDSSNAGGQFFAGPFNFVVQILQLFLFSSFAVAVANACFKLVDLVPTQAITWMGTGPMNNPIGDSTGEIQSEARGFTQQVGQLGTQIMGEQSKRLMELGALTRQDGDINKDKTPAGEPPKAIGGPDTPSGKSPAIEVGPSAGGGPVTVSKSGGGGGSSAAKMASQLPLTEIGERGAADNADRADTAKTTPSSTKSGGNASSASSKQDQSIGAPQESASDTPSSADKGSPSKPSSSEAAGSTESGETKSAEAEDAAPSSPPNKPPTPPSGNQSNNPSTPEAKKPETAGESYLRARREHPWRSAIIDAVTFGAYGMYGAEAVGNDRRAKMNQGNKQSGQQSGAETGGYKDPSTDPNAQYNQANIGKTWNGSFWQ